MRPDDPKGNRSTGDADRPAPRETAMTDRLPQPIRLGIACVYFYGPDSGWILDLQLRYIAQTLAGYDYKIYGGANRLQPELRRTLESTPNVEIVSLPRFEGEGGSEHAFYLDRLLWQAASEGCTHVAALDSDSFPILPDWPDVLMCRMRGGVRLAAVLRSENRDTHLPHPCGYFMERSFLLEHRPSLLPPESETTAATFQQFLKETGQRADTGIGYGYALWKQKEPWLRLTRSNRLNPHFLMAGIYGDVFFHLGASSRQPTFHVDYLTRPSLRLATALRKLPAVWRMASPLEARYIASNARAFRGIVDSLKENPDRFLSSLRVGRSPARAS